MTIPYPCWCQVNTNKFFRGVQRLRGQAAACHLHQMSIDLGRRLTWCDQHQQEVNDLNDHLAELVDTLDDMDGSVVQSDVDEKDPVLMSKRGREKFVKSEQLRGNNFKSGLVQQKPFNPWEDIRKKEIQQRKLERQGIKDEKTIKEEKKKEAERKEWTAIQEAKQERQRRREARKNQPPPPPLPMHLQRVKEEQRKHKEKSRIDQIRRIAAEEKRNKMNGFWWAQRCALRFLSYEPCFLRICVHIGVTVGLAARVVTAVLKPCVLCW